LFGKDRNTRWTRTGLTHSENLVKLIAGHEITVNQIQSSLCIVAFGQSRKEAALHDKLKAENSVHNKAVQRNRNILRRLINCVCFLGKQEFAIRGHGELGKSINHCKYVEHLK
jgi:hypothetical protein